MSHLKAGSPVQQGTQVQHMRTASQAGSCQATVGVAAMCFVARLAPQAPLEGLQQSSGDSHLTKLVKPHQGDQYVRGADQCQLQARRLQGVCSPDHA